MESDNIIGPIVVKLTQQEKPTILFSDLDGTLFSPNLKLLTAPIYNVQIASFLKKRTIPFIIVTGRSFWRRIDRYHLKVLGIAMPDCVITANGSAIYYLQGQRYVADISWQGIMLSTKITDGSGLVSTWNKLKITNTITNYLGQNNFPYFLGQGNTYIIRIRFDRYPIERIGEIRKAILQFFPKGILVILTEKLMWKNTTDIFSGEILITPNTAGKDKAVDYVLKNLASEANSSSLMVNGSEKQQALDTPEVFGFFTSGVRKIHAFVFGDATVDVPMLTMKEDSRFYTLSQYAINPMPLAKMVLEEKMKTNNAIRILHGDGPKEILKVLTERNQAVNTNQEGSSRLHPAPISGAGLRSNNNSPVIARSEATKQSNQPKGPVLDKQFNNVIIQPIRQAQGKQSSLSPAQNNSTRKVIQTFENVLDKIVDKNLSANEISLLGLSQLSQGLSLLHQPNSSLAAKTKGLYHYSFGNLTDILDGVRARQQKRQALTVNREVRSSQKLNGLPLTVNGNHVPGQLVDGFSDRTKEFMQLFHRAKKRMKYYSSSEVSESKSKFSTHSTSSEQTISSNNNSSVIAGKARFQTVPGKAKQSINSTIQQSVFTFLAALSCCLPSIARAQVEIGGKTVSEKDEQGGSMVDRTRRLFLSLLFATFGLDDQSLVTDRKILDTNLATFHHRLSLTMNTSTSSVKKISSLSERSESKGFTDFQKQALERFLFYVDILQQEDTIIKKYLSKRPKILKAYETESSKLAKDYLKLPVNTLRKKWNLKGYKLEVKKFI